MQFCLILDYAYNGCNLHVLGKFDTRKKCIRGLNLFTIVPALPRSQVSILAQFLDLFTPFILSASASLLEGLSLSAYDLGRWRPV